MKRWFKLTLFLIAAFMGFSILQPIKAANYNPHTITIKSENFGHTFEAYQIFKGDLSDGKLTNIEWGLSIIDQEGLLDELKQNEAYVNCNSAQDVAKVLEGLNNAQASDAFADIVVNYLDSRSVGSIHGGIPNEDGYFYYKISVSGDGYYLVKDRDDSLSGNDAYTKYILEVVKDVEVIAKSDYPTLVKSISDTNSAYCNVSVGDVVNYELLSFVPNMDGYEKYYFVITDSFSDGLSYNHDLEIMLGDLELVEDVDYVAIESDQSIQIVFIDFIQYQEAYVNAPIVVTYSLTLNELAISGVNGNSNEATLTYSNNPNYDYQGENLPLDNEPVGNTPSSKTYTYTADLVITKIDGNNGQLLSNAKFKISGTSLNKVQICEDVYLEDENGEYYKLNDGTYTKAIPTSSTQSLYASTTIKYKISYETKYVSTQEGFEAIGVVDDSGTLTFKGLKEGTYTIYEIKAPDGYNLLENPIEVVLQWQAPVNGVDCVWSINGDSSINGITVKNYSGTTLPSTGGIGTSLFYLSGLVLVGIGLYLTRRKENEN